MTTSSFFTRYESFITFLASITVIFSALKLPLSHDIRMYQAAARMADYYGGLPSGIDLAWEIKPIGSRFFHYVLYKLASVLAPYSTAEYEFFVKLFAIAAVALMCWYFSTKIKIPFAFALTFIPVMAVYNQAVLQPEWFAVPMALVAIALMTEDIPECHIFAGILITGIFFMKGITLFLAIPILLAAWIILSRDSGQDPIGFISRYRHEMWKRLETAGFASAGSLVLIFATGWFPRTIPDMLMSSSLARIGYFNPLAMLQNFVYGFFSCYAAVYIPAILVGMAAFLWIAIENKNWRTTAILGVSWVVCLAIVCAQSENVFVYQYIVLVIPAILSLQLIDMDMKVVCLWAIFAMFFLFAMAGTSTNAYVEQQYTLKQRAALQNLTDQFHDIRDQDNILYLDIGDAPYFLQANSSCRYINSLPFQRNELKWNITHLAQYKENYDCIMAYRGKYIVTAEIDRGNGTVNWMKQDTEDNKRVFDHIEEGYDRVWSDAWILYQKKNFTQRNITQ